jgi:hypothetical protein
VAEHTDVLVCMVWDSAALKAMALGEDGFVAGLQPRHVIADASTVEPEVSAEIARLVGETGGVMLDTPVSGSLDAAESGQVMIMAGGPRTALEVIRPVLETLGRAVLHVSEKNGSGLTMKLAINMQVAAQEVAWGEGLALAEASGIDRSQAMAVMLGSVIASPMIKYRAPFVLQPGRGVGQRGSAAEGRGLCGGTQRRSRHRRAARTRSAGPPLCRGQGRPRGRGTDGGCRGRRVGREREGEAAMRAAVLHGPKDLRIREVDEPAPPAEGEITIKVNRCGVCGTDAHEVLKEGTVEH